MTPLLPAEQQQQPSLHQQQPQHQQPSECDASSSHQQQEDRKPSAAMSNLDLHIQQLCSSASPTVVTFPVVVVAAAANTTHVRRRLPQQPPSNRVQRQPHSHDRIKTVRKSFPAGRNCNRTPKKCQKQQEHHQPPQSNASYKPQGEEGEDDRPHSPALTDLDWQIRHICDSATPVKVTCPVSAAAAADNTNSRRHKMPTSNSFQRSQQTRNTIQSLPPVSASVDQRNKRKASNKCLPFPVLNDLDFHETDFRQDDGSRQMLKRKPLNPEDLENLSSLKPSFHFVPSKKRVKQAVSLGSAFPPSDALESTVSLLDFVETASSTNDPNGDTMSSSSRRMPKVKLIECVEQDKKNEIFSLAWSKVYHHRPAYGDDDGGNAGSTSTTRFRTSISKIVAASKPIEVTRYLATCSGGNVAIYTICSRYDVNDTKENEVQEFNGATLVYCYDDDDPTDEYYSCEFAGQGRTRYASFQAQIQNRGERNKPSSHQGNGVRMTRPVLSTGCKSNSLLICVGGERAVIHVIDCTRQVKLGTLYGHGSAVFDLKVSPVDDWLLLSASRDHSCRLWNLRNLTSGPIAVFAGHAGHRDAVNSISWHCSGHRFASGGMDNSISIWDIDTSVQEVIRATHRVANQSEHQPNAEHIFASKAVIQFPVFSTVKVHAHCVDCVQFVGDLLLSKSIENKIRLWHPNIQRATTPLGGTLHPCSSNVTLLRTFQLEDSKNSFMRFAIDPSLEILAAGNTRGWVYLWLLGAARRHPFRIMKIPDPCTIRYLSFSPNGKMLVASTGDGSFYRWRILSTI